jgi:hypothetical protein
MAENLSFGTPGLPVQEARRADSTRRRRRAGVAWSVVIAIVVAIGTSLVALGGVGEHVDALWVGAIVAPDGSARVVEVVDRNFGISRRHGIYRMVPGLRMSAPVQVTSPDAPADVTVSAGVIRIGDPSRTVTGRHRYVLAYTLDGVGSDGRLGWNAVGTWDVRIAHAEVHVVTARALNEVRCVTGVAGSIAPWPIEQIQPGSLVVRTDRLAAGEGVTVYATAGSPLTAAPALPAVPAAPSTDNPLVPGVLAGALTLLAAAATARLLRRAGRERLPAVGVAALAPPGGQARIDLEDLAGYVTASATLPAALTPAQGGMLLADRVTDEHRAAWLLDQAAAGTIGLETPDPHRTDEIDLVRLQPGDAAARPLLDRAFAGRDRLTLGSRDEHFAAGWTALGEQLSAWRRTCGLWDTDADRRARLVRGIGVLVALLGLGLALLGGGLSGRQAGLPLALAGVGGLLVGAGAAAAIRGWELRVLTPAGSAAWLQVESLRRFLASSPPTAVDEAITSGQVGRYTAWALAVGQAERWSQLLSSVPVPAPAGYVTGGLPYAAWGPAFVSSCHLTTVSSSSSGTGSGGFGGGGVGGGAGGGSGGSW